MVKSVPRWGLGRVPGEMGRRLVLGFSPWTAWGESS